MDGEKTENSFRSEFRRILDLFVNGTRAAHKIVLTIVIKLISRVAQFGFVLTLGGMVLTLASLLGCVLCATRWVSDGPLVPFVFGFFFTFALFCLGLGVIYAGLRCWFLAPIVLFKLYRGRKK